MANPIQLMNNAERVMTGLLGLGLLGILYLIIFGNLSGNLGFTDVGTTIINETVLVSGGSGVYTIATITDPTNVNFISWNATLILNASIHNASATSNNTLVEGTDYTINTANGTFFNLTATEWNRTFVTYVVLREASAETDSDNVIDNLTGGIVTFFSFSNTLFTLTAITLLIGVILVVITMVKGGKGSGGRKKSASESLSN